MSKELRAILENNTVKINIGNNLSESDLVFIISILFDTLTPNAKESLLKQLNNMLLDKSNHFLQ